MNAKFCQNCIKNNQSWGGICFIGYYGGKTFKIPENNKCLWCGNDLIESNLSTDELKTLNEISSDNSFLEAMIDLKEKDIIEYELKMSQFRSQVTQKEQHDNRGTTSPTVKCPYCQSTNTKKITNLSKVTNIALFGIFGNKRKHQWHCNNCNSDF